MSRVRDAIVVGLGAAGSATLYQLARRGVRAVGIDRFSPPHERGSSHGDTRITRVAIGEGGEYVPLVRRSHEIWRELEATTGRSLLSPVGGLIYGSTTSRASSHGAEDFLAETIAVAREHKIEHELLDASAMRSRFPALKFQDEDQGYYEPGAGFVRPEACIAAQLGAARALGAEIFLDEQVHSWSGGDSGVRVITDRGRYEAGALVLCAGAWMPGLVSALAAHVKTYRQVLYWFGLEAPASRFEPERMGIFIRVPDAYNALLYGFPAIDGPDYGIKIASEQMEVTQPPDEMALEVSADEISAMRAFAMSHVAISGNCLRAISCKYAVTPDHGFVIDQHPGEANTWLVSACSGHGFKHSAAVGESLAEWIADGVTSIELGAFRLSRFDAGS